MAVPLSQVSVLILDDNALVLKCARRHRCATSRL
jgi:hypothetical protein